MRGRGNFRVRSRIPDQGPYFPGLLPETDCRVLEVQRGAWQDPAQAKPYETEFGTNTVNYCKTCRRYLNDAVSCPGCGSRGIAVPRERDLRSTAWTPQVTGGEQPGPRRAVPEQPPAQSPAVRRAPPRDPVPTAMKDIAISGGGRHGRGGAEADAREHAAERVGNRSALAAAAGGLTAGGGASAGARAGVGAHAARLDAAGNGMGLGSDYDDDSSGYSANGVHRGRRSQRRRGFGPKIAGGCAGIAVVGFLLLCGNLSSGGNGAPAGSVAAVPTPAAGSSTASSIVAAPTQTFTGSVSNPAADLNPLATSASPSSLKKPNQSPTSSRAPQSTTPSAAPTSAKSSPTPNQSTPPPPSPSQTHVTCVLFCW